MSGLLWWFVGVEWLGVVVEVFYGLASEALCGREGIGNDSV